VFGQDPSGRTRISDPTDSSRTAEWLLEAQYDPKGNAIRYEYKPEDGTVPDGARRHERRRIRERSGLSNRYIKRIRYGNTKPLSFGDAEPDENDWLFEAVVDYGEHAADAGPPSYEEKQSWPLRPDPFSTFQSGFEVRTYRLCRRVLMFHRFKDEFGDEPLLVGATELDHDQDPAGASLTAVRYTGYRHDLESGGIDTRSTPDLTFSYTSPSVGNSFKTAPQSAEINVPWGVDGLQYQWVDLEGEGVPGILFEDQNGWYYKGSLGGGEFEPLRQVDELPTRVAAEFMLQDADADGELEFGTTAGRNAGHFERNRTTGEWSGYEPVQSAVQTDFVTAQVQQADLTGDGRADLVIDRQNRFVWYEAQEEGGFKSPVEVSKPEESGGISAATADANGEFVFADMNGDGLADLVRIGNGRVDYWPNQGRGRFGNPVTMANAPFLDRLEELNRRRLFLTDLDGSGTSDLIYVDDGEVRYWINRSGNEFGDGSRIDGLPHIDDLSTLDVVDFLGDGTKCLVWSATASGADSLPLRYLPLTGDAGPRSVTEVDNSCGRRTRFTYGHSSREYLRDKRSGDPWRTRLPTHVAVVRQVEVVDEINDGRRLERFEYRNGDFDEEERAFAGFGQVDRYDSDLSVTDGTDGQDVPRVPASLTRTWFETGGVQIGIDERTERSDRFFADDPDHWRLPDWTLADETQTLSSSAYREAIRSLAGRIRRREVYPTTEAGERAPTPFQTEEHAYAVRQLQPAIEEKDSAVFAYETETLNHEYDGQPEDPRVTHQLRTAVGTYGNPTRTVTIAYPRRGSGNLPDPQKSVHVDGRVVRYENVDTPERYEVGIEFEEQTFELDGFTVPPDGPLPLRTVQQELQTALQNVKEYGASLDGNGPEARLQTWEQRLFWDDQQESSASLGEIGEVTLLHHVRRAVFSPSYASDVFGDRVSNELLKTEGKYERQRGYWWAAGPIHHYRNGNKFYRLRRKDQPSGRRRTIEIDRYAYHSTALEDNFGNRIELETDYQALSLQRKTDANDNVEEVRYNPMGMPVLRSTHGRRLGRDGAEHPIGDEPVAQVQRTAGTGLSDVTSDPGALVGKATKAWYYDVDTWNADGEPPHSVAVTRKQHLNDGEGGRGSGELDVTVQYVDGFGRDLQVKRRAGEGEAVALREDGSVVTDTNDEPESREVSERWLTSGHVVFTNKGLPARRYEPYYSPRVEFDSDQHLRSYGVAAEVNYDARGREVRRDLPEGTYETTQYGPWSVTERDANDTVETSDWARERAGLASGNPAREALERTRSHADTPEVRHLDPLGRAFKQVEFDGSGNERVEETRFDAGGRPERRIDARGLTAYKYRRDMLGRVLYQESVDKGEQWVLRNTSGDPVRVWDGRGIQENRSYDGGRLTQIRVEDDSGLDNVVRQVKYGDDSSTNQAKLRNLRGRVRLVRDDSGQVNYERRSSDGNVLSKTRQLRKEYKQTVDWSQPEEVALESDSYTTELLYNAYGQVIKKWCADGTERERDYSALGEVNQIRISTEDGELDRKAIVKGTAYNARDQRTLARYGNGVEVRQKFDDQSFRLKRLTVQDEESSGRRYMDVSYYYDPVGNVTRWIDQVQEPGQSTSLLEGSTVTTARTFEYDAFYRLTRATGRVHQQLLQHDYRSEAGGTKGTRHLSFNNGEAVERYERTYSYDLAGNINEIQHTGPSHQWTTDIWTSEQSNRSFPAEDASGRAIQNPESRFDANGNCTGYPHLHRMEWNWQDRLSAAVLVDRSGMNTDDAEYSVYGADAQRVRRVTERIVNGSTEIAETIYLDGCEIRRVRRGGQIQLQRQSSHLSDGTSTVATLHQWGVDTRNHETEDVDAKRIHYRIDNHLGSVVLETNDSGDIITYEEYFPYGRTSFLAGDDMRDVRLKTYRYSGKVRDDLSGLYEFGHRHYAPFIGNWVSPDPLGERDGLNAYWYGRNNPIRFKDPSGLQAKDESAPLRKFQMSGKSGEQYEKLLRRKTPKAKRALRRIYRSATIKHGGKLYWLENIQLKWEEVQGTKQWVLHAEAVEVGAKSEATTQSPSEGSFTRDEEAETTDASGTKSKETITREDTEDAGRGGEPTSGENQNGERGEGGQGGTEDVEGQGGEQSNGEKESEKEKKEKKESEKNQPPEANAESGSNGRGGDNARGEGGSSGSTPNGNGRDEGSKGASSGSSKNGGQDVPKPPREAETSPNGVPYTPDIDKDDLRGVVEAESVEELDNDGEEYIPESEEKKGSSAGMSEKGKSDADLLRKLQEVARLLELDFEQKGGGAKRGSIFGGLGLLNLGRLAQIMDIAYVFGSYLMGAWGAAKGFLKKLGKRFAYKRLLREIDEMPITIYRVQPVDELTDLTRKESMSGYVLPDERILNKSHSEILRKLDLNVSGLKSRYSNKPLAVMKGEAPLGKLEIPYRKWPSDDKIYSSWQLGSARPQGFISGTGEVTPEFVLPNESAVQGTIERWIVP